MDVAASIILRSSAESPKLMPVVLDIIKEPDKILRGKAKEVSPDSILTAPIQRLIAQMKDTLAATPDGVGLAAPQIGKPLQVFIVSEEAENIDRIEKMLIEKKSEPISPEIKLPQKEQWNYRVFINPIVKNVSKRKLGRSEGCLSVPGKFGEVRRHEKITVEAYNENGKKFTRGAARFFARVMQHELDHLQGTLFIDKAGKLFESGDNEKKGRD